MSGKAGLCQAVFQRVVIFRWYGLRAHMALSYVLVTLGTFLSFQALALLVKRAKLVELASSASVGELVAPIWTPLAPQLTGSLLASELLSNLVWLALMTPIGLLFGWITTRSLVNRVQQVARATTQVAEGDYSQRVEVSRRLDEVSQLERQFNRMAEQLAETIAQRQRLAEQNARFQERSRISRELHDAISQDLFSLRMLADGLQEATQANPEMASLRPHIAVLEQATSSMTRQMRALLLELRPVSLLQRGLVEALKELAHAYQARLNITVTTDLSPVFLSARAEQVMLRIAQEALTNAARHSNATLISLRLESYMERVKFTITDNGCGFDREHVYERCGLGIHLMQERVQECDGNFSLKTAPGHGTRISVSFPQEKQSGYGRVS